MYSLKTSAVSGGNTGAIISCLISDVFTSLPITIARADSRFTGKKYGPCLYGFQTSSRKYAPFFATSVLASNAASAQKDIILRTDGEDTIAQFKALDYIQVVDDNATEKIQIDSIAVNTITCKTNLANTYTTAANAKIYLVDGTEDSANAVLVFDTVDFDTAEDGVLAAAVDGVFKEEMINRRTNLVKASSRLTIKTAVKQ